MLETLNDIPWKDLGHAYGSAEDVPGLIRDLAGSDDQQEEALSAFFGNIWHQGTVYEASAYAVPFLMELASNRQVSRRDEILGLVGAIAEGNSYLEVHAPHSEFHRARSDFDAQLRRELEHVSNARQAVRRHQAVLEQLLFDLDPMVRVAAAHVLTRFPQSWTEIEPLLRCVLRAEANVLARAGMIWSIGTGRNDSPTIRSLLEDVIRERFDHRLVLAAAVALHLLTNERPEGADWIYGCMVAARWYAEAFLVGVPWDFSGEVQLDELLSDVQPDPEGATRMLLQALLDPEVSEYSHTAVVHDLLHLNFPNGNWREKHAEWSAKQREVMRGIVSTDAVWRDSKHLWFLVPDGAKRISSLTAKDLAAVRIDMATALAHQDA